MSGAPDAGSGGNSRQAKRRIDSPASAGAGGAAPLSLAIPSSSSGGGATALLSPTAALSPRSRFPVAEYEALGVKYKGLFLADARAARLTLIKEDPDLVLGIFAKLGLGVAEELVALALAPPVPVEPPTTIDEALELCHPAGWAKKMNPDLARLGRFVNFYYMAPGFSRDIKAIIEEQRKPGESFEAAEKRLIKSHEGVFVLHTPEPAAPCALSVLLKRDTVTGALELTDETDVPHMPTALFNASVEATKKKYPHLAAVLGSTTKVVAVSALTPNMVWTTASGKPPPAGTFTAHVPATGQKVIVRVIKQGNNSAYPKLVFTQAQADEVDASGMIGDDDDDYAEVGAGAPGAVSQLGTAHYTLYFVMPGGKKPLGASVCHYMPLSLGGASISNLNLKTGCKDEDDDKALRWPLTWTGSGFWERFGAAAGEYSAARETAACTGARVCRFEAAARAALQHFLALVPLPSLSSSSLACKQARSAPSWRAWTGA